jgi:hypothetical protein
VGWSAFHNPIGSTACYGDGFIIIIIIIITSNLFNCRWVLPGGRGTVKMPEAMHSLLRVYFMARCLIKHRCDFNKGRRSTARFVTRFIAAVLYPGLPVLPSVLFAVWSGS